MGKRQGEEEEHDKQWSQNIHIQTNIRTYTQLMSWMKVYFVWLVHDIVSFIFTLTKWRLYYFRSVHTVHIIHEITDVNFKPINPMRLINLYLTCLRLREKGDQSCTTYNTVEKHTSCKKKPKKPKKKTCNIICIIGTRYRFLTSCILSQILLLNCIIIACTCGQFLWQLNFANIYRIIAINILSEFHLNVKLNWWLFGIDYLLLILALMKLSNADIVIDEVAINCWYWC